jgi:hypothetical protein
VSELKRKIQSEKDAFGFYQLEFNPIYLNFLIIQEKKFILFSFDSFSKVIKNQFYLKNKVFKIINIINKKFLINYI